MNPDVCAHRFGIHGRNNSLEFIILHLIARELQNIFSEAYYYLFTINDISIMMMYFYCKHYTIVIIDCINQIKIKFLTMTSELKEKNDYLLISLNATHVCENLFPSSLHT